MLCLAFGVGLIEPHALGQRVGRRLDVQVDQEERRRRPERVKQPRDDEVRLRPRAGFQQQHINVLEARAVLFAVRRLVRDGARDARVLVLCDSRVCVGAFGKGRSSSRRLNFPLRCVVGLALAHGITLEIVWIPTWANPTDAPSRGRPLSVWRCAAPCGRRHLRGEEE